MPRENLNGLLIPNSGLSAVLYALTGIGSPWAQDPPWSAEVLGFQTGPDVDWSHTRLADWRGWQHDRWINLYHGGPVAVIDRANGAGDRPPALTWHLQQQAPVSPTLLPAGPGGRLRLRDGDHPLEVVLAPLPGDGRPGSLSATPEGAGRIGVTYTAGRRDALALATIFLPDQWAGAAVNVTSGDQGPVARVTQGTQTMDIPLYR